MQRPRSAWLCSSAGCSIPGWATSLPFVTAFGAVAAAVWAAGWLPAGFVAIIGYFAFSYLFIPPRHTLAFGTVAHVVGMLAYLLSCGLIIGIGEAMRAAKVRRDRLSATLATQRRDAHEKAEELLDARQLASIVESFRRRHHRQVAGRHHPELE